MWKGREKDRDRQKEQERVKARGLGEKIRKCSDSAHMRVLTMNLKWDHLTR